MSSLKQLQEDFQSAVLKADPSLLTHTLKPLKHSDQKLNVYVEGYRLRLIEALSVDYPKVQVLLGHQAFEQVCREYIAQHPSQNFSLRDFGQHYKSFLAQTHPGFPQLAQMADFEWVLKQSLDSKDMPLFTLNDLAQIPADQWGYLRLTWHSSVNLRTYDWDVPQLWSDIEHTNRPRQAIKLQRPQRWICWRHELKSMYASLNEVQVAMAEGICAHQPLAATAEQLCDLYPPDEVPKLLVQTLQLWVQQGLLAH